MAKSSLLQLQKTLRTPQKSHATGVMSDYGLEIFKITHQKNQHGKPFKSLKSLHVVLISHCLMASILLPVRKWPID